MEQTLEYAGSSTRTHRVRVLLVDDHALVRDSFARCLETEDGIEVAAVASDAQEGIELARKHEPDVILMDIDMPGLSCFSATKIIGRDLKNTRVIFLSGFKHDRYIENALEAGAMGYLTKSEPPERVIEAIYLVAAKKSCFSDDVYDRIIVDSKGPRLSSEGLAGSKTRLSALTPREKEVMHHLAMGLGKKEIGQLLHVTVKTIDKHTENLMRKLDIHDRVELALFAIREGIISA